MLQKCDPNAYQSSQQSLNRYVVPPSCNGEILATVVELGSMRAAIQNEYADRAREYASLLGSMDAVHSADRHLVEAWAD